MKKTVCILLAVLLVGIFCGCKKSESLDDKINKSKTVDVTHEEETGESLEQDLKNWHGAEENPAHLYSPLVPSKEYEVTAATPYAKEMQTMQGMLRALGRRLNQYYALYRIYPAGKDEEVLEAIKTKNPADDDILYQIACQDEFCTMTATFADNSHFLRGEDNYWPQFSFSVTHGTYGQDGYVIVEKKEASAAAVALDDFVAHEETCISLGGEMSKYGCVLKEKMSASAKKDACGSLGGEMKDGECVLKEDLFL